MKRFFENKSVNRLAQALKRNGRFDEAVWIALSVEIQILSPSSSFWRIQHKFALLELHHTG